MVKIHILVEGQTEHTFVQDILVPHFGRRNIFVSSKILTTKITKSGMQFKGGISKYEKIKKDVRRLLNDTSVAVVTTMIDYYGFPPDIPGGLPKGTDCYKKVSELEDKFKQDINNPRFLPYLELHEFESLIFSAPDKITGTFTRLKSTSKNELDILMRTYSTPEEINDGEATHPSARLQKIIPEYNKELYGAIITKRIGLKKIRERCKHFNEWLIKLEEL